VTVQCSAGVAGCCCGAVQSECSAVPRSRGRLQHSCSTAQAWRKRQGSALFPQ
jgi:hypothetical protein